MANFKNLHHPCSIFLYNRSVLRFFIDKELVAW